MAIDTITQVNNRISELSELYARMDATKSLLIDPYTLKNFAGNSMSNVVSVTSNVAKIFSNNIIADLQAATRQVVVSGDGLSKTKIRDIESFGDYAFSQADEKLAISTGEGGGLWAWLCKHVANRSYIGARFVTTIKDGGYDIEVMPVDMRWCPFVFNKWACNITFRSASELQAYYETVKGVDQKVLASLTGQDLEVWDHWNNENNEVYVAKNLLLKQPNPYKELPYVIVAPSVGWGFRDKGYLKYEAEDIFYLIRDLIGELNRSLSIEQSLGMDILEPALEQESSDGLLNSDAPPKTGETLKVKKGELHKPVPRGDMNTASLTARQDIQKAIQQGSYNDIDLGNVSQQVSAVWITQQQSIRNKFGIPRLQALSMFYKLAHRLIIKQAAMMVPGQVDKLQVGKTGKRRTFNIASFGDPSTYDINYQYMAGKSKSLEVANLTLAISAKDVIPRREIYEVFLQASDPDRLVREMEMQNAKESDPFSRALSYAIEFAREGNNLEDPVEADLRLLESIRFTDEACAILEQSYLARTQQTRAPEQAAIESKGKNTNESTQSAAVASMGRQQ